RRHVTAARRRHPTTRVAQPQIRPPCRRRCPGTGTAIARARYGAWSVEHGEGALIVYIEVGVTLVLSENAIPTARTPRGRIVKEPKVSMPELRTNGSRC